MRVLECLRSAAVPFLLRLEHGKKKTLLVPQLEPIFTVLDLIPKYENARKRSIFESPPNKKCTQNTLVHSCKNGFLAVSHQPPSSDCPFPSRRSHGGHHLLKTPMSTAIQPAVLPGVAATVLNDPFEPGVFAVPCCTHQRLWAFLGIPSEN